ncbi:restriction endonuclease subunit S [Enterobacteriaceae bacterium Kacie_13]|nr:restriction endonuclease subunit S [Enterobacteriaceae bacterium Kacie_13]
MRWKRKWRVICRSWVMSKVPAGWELKSLGEVAELQRGFDLPAKDRVDGNIPIISSGGYSGFHNEPRAMSPGIVTGRYGSIGDVYFIEEDFWPLNTSLWVKNFHGNEPKYLYYLLSSIDYKKFSDKTGVPGVNRNDLHAIKVFVPPYKEQTKIAKILSTWDKAIATTEKLIGNSQQQKKALMQSLLTGKKRLPGFEGELINSTLGDACYINPKKASRPEGGLVSFISMDSVSEDAKLIRTEVRNYDDVEKGFTSFSDNDVLVAKITPCFENGKGAYLDELKNGVGFGSTEFHVLHAKKNTYSKFVYYVTNTDEFRVRGEANMQGSAGQKRVTTDYLKQFPLKLPPLPEQQKIAAVLTAADNEIELLKKKLVFLKQEKTALMQQLLTGKRRVKINATEECMDA